jgi:hypothetical protein
LVHPGSISKRFARAPSCSLAAAHYFVENGGKISSLVRGNEAQIHPEWSKR